MHGDHVGHVVRGIDQKQLTEGVLKYLYSHQSLELHQLLEEPVPTHFHIAQPYNQQLQQRE